MQPSCQLIRHGTRRGTMREQGECVLRRLLRQRRIARVPQRRAEDQARIPLHQPTKRCIISLTGVALEQYGIGVIHQCVYYDMAAARENRTDFLTVRLAPGDVEVEACRVATGGSGHEPDLTGLAASRPQHGGGAWRMSLCLPRTGLERAGGAVRWCISFRRNHNPTRSAGSGRGRYRSKPFTRGYTRPCGGR